jgi:hypothetical protein
MLGVSHGFLAVDSENESKKGENTMPVYLG